MNKGIKALIGGVIGYFALGLIICIIEGENVFDDKEAIELSLIVLMPGAIVGAIIGSVSGGKKERKRQKDDDEWEEEGYQSQQTTSAAELVEFKNLIASGIISQEEFNDEKTKFLKYLVTNHKSKTVNKLMDLKTLNESQIITKDEMEKYKKQIIEQGNSITKPEYRSFVLTKNEIDQIDSVYDPSAVWNDAVDNDSIEINDENQHDAN